VKVKAIEFKRSRLTSKKEESITKKTIFLGILTVGLFVLMIVFGLPFLVKFSVFLGESKKNQNEELLVQTLPPLPPRLILPFEATNSARISIAGVAEPGVVVELLKNDVMLDSTQTSQQGEFNFTLVDLNEGDNFFSAVAITEKGGSSDLLKSLVVTFDNQLPELEITNPSEEKLTIDYDDFDIVGKTEGGASVLINGKVTIVDDEGNFKLKVQLEAGKNEFEVVVKDLAGNEVRRKIEITYDI